ncbi:hypothetical protein TVAG_440080 [Trichomonas vaginalis G3]|uniref:Uncharacterized protein n=1 Tax=Trichomonas vaginalis (strain ATCC PRA-98 / G3) TaxID=412133 RepID=A2FDL1_TRIV3|nr:hypothetical protein TVAGG3_0952490 [Trichomonas vaginalis G3]EAX96992.1 hypothetical protein TVAG_440080 [Trichomonas vaginalis G3]KAI5487311.1 hypothetical protein TVAGG3_0952490 [Trichomonas vaginalis G3]|eukprot:XP_001309922.1 hypothetical protein [Trichomonas vaginalis G3]
MSTLPTLSHKISVEVGVPGDHQNRFYLYFEKPVNDKISSIEFIESEFTIATRDESFNFALDKIIIDDTVPIEIDTSKFTFKGTKYIKLPISLCDRINIEEILNVKLTFPMDGIDNVDLYSNKITLELSSEAKRSFSTKVSNISFAFPRSRDSVNIYRKDKEVTPLYIADTVPHLKFNSDWDNYKGYAVYAGIPGDTVIVEANTSYLPIKLLYSCKLLLYGHNVSYTTIYLPAQPISELEINILSIYKINLIIDNPIFEQDILIQCPLKGFPSGSNVFINNAVVDGITATFSGVLINGTLSATPGSFIDLSNSEISTDAVINLSITVGFTSSVINLSDTIGFDVLNVHWNISDPLLYAPYTSHEPILHANSKISKDIWVNFYPESMKLINGIVKPTASYNDKDLYASFDAAAFSHKKLNSAQVLAIITAAVTASIFLVLIVYTFVSTRKREQHGYERYLI